MKQKKLSVNLVISFFQLPVSLVISFFFQYLIFIFLISGLLFFIFLIYFCKVFFFYNQFFSFYWQLKKRVTDNYQMLIFFIIFACLSLFSALMILVVERVIHAAFWLLMSFLGIAGVYVLAGADFLAVSQIVVYIGGVLILLLFGIMLTTQNQAIETENIENQQVNNFSKNTVKDFFRMIFNNFFIFINNLFFKIENLLCFGLFIWLSFYILKEEKWKITPQISTQTTIYQIGVRLLTEHFLAFELVGVLLLVVLVGILVFTNSSTAPKGRANPKESVNTDKA